MTDEILILFSVIGICVFLVLVYLSAREQRRIEKRMDDLRKEIRRLSK